MDAYPGLGQVDLAPIQEILSSEIPPEYEEVQEIFATCRVALELIQAGQGPQIKKEVQQLASLLGVYQMSPENYKPDLIREISEVQNKLLSRKPNGVVRDSTFKATDVWSL